MPLEVRELIIRALVDPAKSTQNRMGKNRSSFASSERGRNTDSWESQKALLDQFNEMLKRKKER